MWISLILLLAACGQTTNARPVKTTAVTQDPALLARFTRVVWPTIVTYRFSGQGDPQDPLPPGSDRDKFNAVLDENAGGVKIEAQKIGEVLDAQGVSTGETDHLALASATISSLDGAHAQVIACYTYNFTARSPWPHDHDRAVSGSSEVTFTLHKNGDWLVSDLGNDHVVPSCPSGRA